MAGTKRKGRTAQAYQRKVDEIKNWHSERVESRKLWSKKRFDKTKTLKPLEFYIDQIRKPGDK